MTKNELVELIESLPFEDNTAKEVAVVDALQDVLGMIADLNGLIPDAVQWRMIDAVTRAQEAVEAHEYNHDCKVMLDSE